MFADRAIRSSNPDFNYLLGYIRLNINNQPVEDIKTFKLVFEQRILLCV